MKTKYEAAVKEIIYKKRERVFNVSTFIRRNEYYYQVLQ